MRHRTLGVVVVISAVTGLLLALDAPPALRWPAATAFVLLCPTLGWISLLRLPDRGDALLLTVATSVALTVVVAEGMALLRIWSTVGAFAVLASVGVLGAVMPPRQAPPPGRSGRHRSTTPKPVSQDAQR